MEKFINNQGMLAYKDNKLIEVIDYLSHKYDLYIITDWFTETQKKRLEKMEILKYFKKVIGADINYLKTTKKAYDCILKDYKPSDCISIGDNLKKDIKEALELGMDAIYFNDLPNKEYKTINKIEELMVLL